MDYEAIVHEATVRMVRWPRGDTTLKKNNTANKTKTRYKYKRDVTNKSKAPQTKTNYTANKKKLKENRTQQKE